MKKNKLFSALVMAFILAAVFAVPVFASNGSLHYIPELTRRNMILVFTPLILIVTLAVYLFSGARKGEEKGLWKTAINFLEFGPV